MPSVGSILFCVLLIIFLYLYLRISLMINSEFFLNNVRVVFMGIIILCLRAVVPINFPFTITFPIKRGLPQITSFFFGDRDRKVVFGRMSSDYMGSRSANCIGSVSISILSV